MTALKTRGLTWVPIAAAPLAVGWGANQFTPMLLVYHQTMGLSTGTLEAMFGFYALGLIPGLLIAGPLSDARGRRAVVVPAAGLSLTASLALIAGRQGLALLFAGRLLAGISSGAAFSAGTAWLREVSRPPFGNASDHAAAVRTAVAMTTGFALGPLATGLLAQWVPGPRVVPYLPHVALMVAVLALLRGAPETVRERGRLVLRLAPAGARNPRFRGIVAPMAPWTFAAPVIAFALLPSVVGADRTTNGIALTAAITALCALAGVLVQPLARRLAHPATIGVLVVVAGLVLAAVTAQLGQTWLLVPSAIVLGAAYGLCLVAGLLEVQRIADAGSLAGLTAVYYALTYVGFAAPYLLALGSHVASYAALLALSALLALATAALVARPRRGTVGERVPAAL